MKLIILLSKDLRLFVDGVKAEGKSIRLPEGFHRLRIEQTHPLYQRFWPKYLLNPFRFFGTAFFKSEHGLHKAYNSEAAVLEGELEIKKDAVLWAVPKLLHFRENPLQGFWNIEVHQKGLSSLLLHRIPPKSFFRRRWLFPRLFPCGVMLALFWAVGLFTGKALWIPLIYSLLCIPYALALFGNRPLIHFPSPKND